MKKHPTRYPQVKVPLNKTPVGGSNSGHLKLGRSKGDRIDGMGGDPAGNAPVTKGGKSKMFKGC